MNNRNGSGTGAEQSPTHKDILKTKVADALDAVEHSIPRVVVSRPYTFAEVNVAYAGKRYEGYGFSKVCWPDPFDETEGRVRAIKRARKNAMKKILHDIKGVGQVKEEECSTEKVSQVS